MKNYLRFKVMGGNILMKAGVVPHKFDCQLDEKKGASNLLTYEKKERKQRKPLIHETIAANEREKQKSDGDAVASDDIPSTSTGSGKFKVFCISVCLELCFFFVF